MKGWLIQRGTAILIILALILGYDARLFVLAHVYLGLNEILADYIHHEVTRTTFILLLRMLLLTLGVALEYSQVVRHRFLVSRCKGSNPFTPDTI